MRIILKTVVEEDFNKVFNAFDLDLFKKLNHRG
jgi:hypothetical protein